MCLCGLCFIMFAFVMSSLKRKDKIKKKERQIIHYSLYCSEIQGE